MVIPQPPPTHLGPPLPPTKRWPGNLLYRLVLSPRHMFRRATFDVLPTPVRPANADIPRTVDFQAMQGSLAKQSRKNSTLRKTVGDDGWRQRWFVLDGSMLSWYRCSTPSSEDFRGQLPLEKASVSQLSEKELRAQRANADLSLKLVDKDGKPFYLQAATSQERADWLSALEQNIYLTANPRGGRYAAQGLVAQTSAQNLVPWKPAASPDSDFAQFQQRRNLTGSQKAPPSLGAAGSSQSCGCLLPPAPAGVSSGSAACAASTSCDSLLRQPPIPEAGAAPAAATAPPAAARTASIAPAVPARPTASTASAKADSASLAIDGRKPGATNQLHRAADPYTPLEPDPYTPLEPDPYTPLEPDPYTPLEAAPAAAQYGGYDLEEMPIRTLKKVLSACGIKDLHGLPRGQLVREARPARDPSRGRQDLGSERRMLWDSNRIGPPATAGTEAEADPAPSL